MAWSDFHFLKLRHQITSIFLVLPLNRLDGYSRWLRLLVSQALRHRKRRRRAPPIAIQAPNGAPEGPVPSSCSIWAVPGRLEAVERDIGLMESYDLQLWPVLQDMS